MRDLAIIAAANNTPLSSDYYRYRKIWLALGVPAFIAVMVIFWLMVFKPVEVKYKHFLSFKTTFFVCLSSMIICFLF